METDEVKNKVDQLVVIIGSLSASQRMLTQSALDLQALGLAKKHQIEESIDRADELGDILGTLIELLQKVTDRFVCMTGNDPI